jgi:hypothetical protein
MSKKLKYVIFTFFVILSYSGNAVYSNNEKKIDKVNTNPMVDNDKFSLFIIVSSIDLRKITGLNSKLEKTDRDKLNLDEIAGVNLKTIILSKSPVFTVDDIISYERNTHVITLTWKAYHAISWWEIKTPFAVCLGRRPIYFGAIWSSYISVTLGCPVILLPRMKEREPKWFTSTTIRIDIGYPTEEYFIGADPRQNAEIMKSLEKAGKLVNAP